MMCALGTVVQTAALPIFRRRRVGEAPQRFATIMSRRDAVHRGVDPALHRVRRARRIADMVAKIAERLHIARRRAPVDAGRTRQRLDALLSPQDVAALPRPFVPSSIFPSHSEAHALPRAYPVPVCPHLTATVLFLYIV